MGSNKAVKVNDPDHIYHHQKDDRDLVRTLHCGTKPMREAGEKYLPREYGESEKEYKARLNRSFLFPGVENAIDDITGRIFRNPFKLDLKGNADLQPIIDDIDMAGNHLQRFMQDAFKNGALVDGIAYILIDNPRVTVDNLAEQKAANIRPFFRLIKANDMLGLRIGRINGIESITQARIMEESQAPDGEFGTKCVQRIRVLEPGYYALYEQPAPDRDYEKIEEGPMDCDAVPIVPLYSERMSFMRGRPPLINLAWLNVAHWQSSSDQRNILRIGRVPIIVVSGARREEIEDDKGNVTVGSSRIFAFSSPETSMRFVEHSGAAITAGADDLKSLEEKMKQESAQLIERPGDQTATEAAIKTSENNSWIDDMTGGVKRATDEALAWVQYWLGKEKTTAPVIDLDLNVSGKPDSDELDTINKARDRGDISRVTYLKELARRNLFSEDFDPEEEAKLAEEEDEKELSLSRPPVPPPPVPGKPPEGEPGEGEEDEGENEMPHEGMDEEE